MSSKSIYTSNFTPTYLYIKQHLKTGKLYFGKTVGNPVTYQGSGKYWRDHIHAHDKTFVVTLWFCLFYDRETIIEFANLFCEQHGIGESTEIWANLQPENGIDGGAPGFVPVFDNEDSTNKFIPSKEYKENKIRYKHPIAGKIAAFDLIENKFCTVDSEKFRIDDRYTSPNAGKVFATDLVTGKSENIPIVVFRANKDQYRCPNSGFVVVREISTGNPVRISKSEFKDNKDNYNGLTVGTSLVDLDGIIRRVSKSDVRISSGEAVVMQVMNTKESRNANLISKLRKHLDKLGASSIEEFDAIIYTTAKMFKSVCAAYTHLGISQDSYSGSLRRTFTKMK